MKDLLRTEHSVSISPYTILFAIGVVLGLYFLFLIKQILLIFFLAVIFMSALQPAVLWLNKRLRFPKILAILSLYVLIVTSIVLTVILVVPPLVKEVPNLLVALNLPTIPDTIANFKLDVNEIGAVFTQFGSSIKTVTGLITTTFSSIFQFVTILVMTLYMLLDHDNLHKRIKWFSQQERHVKLAQEFLNTVEFQLGSWVRAQFLLMLTIGIVTFIGMNIIGVPYAIPLALAAGLLEILPNLGPTIAAIPAIAVAYITFGAPTAGAVIIFYIVVQQLENHLIVPKIMKENVDVSPLATILLILIGFTLDSVLGALLAVPIYIFARTAYGLWMRERAVNAKAA